MKKINLEDLTRRLDKGRSMVGDASFVVETSSCAETEVHHNIDQMGVASIAAFNDLIAAGPIRLCEDVAETGIDAIAEREAA